MDIRLHIDHVLFPPISAFFQKRQAALGLSPNVVIFNAAISSCEKASEWPAALAIFGASLQGCRAMGLYIP